MKGRLLYIDRAGTIYRGFGRLWPELVWDPACSGWRPAELDLPLPEPWGELVTPSEAERLAPGSTSVPPPREFLDRELSAEELIRYRPELFDGYDGPIYRRSPDERLAISTIDMLPDARGKRR